MKPRDFQNLCLLIADDHNFSRVTLLRLLKKLGDPQTLSATNGVEAVSILDAPPERIDCVILDFDMPVMHGLQVLKHIRAGHANVRRDLPVIMLTAHADRDLVDLAIHLDVNAFLLKPVTIDSLRERLTATLSADRKNGASVKSAEEYGSLDMDSRIAGLLNGSGTRPAGPQNA